MTTTPTADRAEEVASELAGRIASGVYDIGSKLPAVRDLAKEFEVSVTTIRSAVAILEEALLVQTRPRVGTIVRDPLLHGGIRSWALLARPSNRHAPWLRTWLADAMRLRRQVALLVLRDLMKQDLDAAIPQIEAAIDEMEACAKRPDADEFDLVDTEMNAMRAVLRAAGHMYLMSVINELASQVARAPGLRALFTPDSDDRVRRWRAFVGLLPMLSESNIEGITGPLMRAGDKAALAKFDAWVAGS